MHLYDFTITDNQDNVIKLSDYKGKVLLIVNTATACGFTPQYAELQQLYQKYKDHGFEILDFPCNQFANQAPGTSEEIAMYCMKRYSITFRQFKKVLVNGKRHFPGTKKEEPLFTYLKDKKPGIFGIKRIKWNFTKFLISRSGEVMYRFSPSTSPIDLESKIVHLLEQPEPESDL